MKKATLCGLWMMTASAMGASTAAHADVIAPPTPTPEPAPIAESPPAPPEKSPLEEAADLIEKQANTKANLQKAIDLYEANLGDKSLDAKARAEGYADLARAYLRLGDIESADAKKIATYEKGQAAGKKAVDAAGGKHAAGLFWSTANMACIGRTRGVMNSLFMVGDLKKGMNEVLAMDSNFHLARNTLGEIEHAIPGLAGGSDDRAEKGYQEVLKRNPHFTATMILYARLKKDQGDKDAARAWAQKVLDEKKPARYMDWKKFDVRDAKKLLTELK